MQPERHGLCPQTTLDSPNLGVSASEATMQRLDRIYILLGLCWVIVGMIYERRHTKEIAAFGGLAHVMPLYANTHTESSGTGLQTTRFREEARETIRRAVGGSGDHAVIFTGSGSTSGIGCGTMSLLP